MQLQSELRLLETAVETLSEGFDDLGFGGAVDEQQIEAVLQQVATRLHDNYPYHHVRYAGQMLKPPHPVARLAYALSLWINPNNHALDGGRASSAMEKECVRELAGIFGWDEYLGHLTSGGTMANLEALWVSGELHPGKAIVASDQSHYTHGRISHVLKLDYRSVASNPDGSMDLDALEHELTNGDVGTIVATLGTTGAGAVDDLPGILELAKRHSARVHVDAAYGGYFTLASRLAPEIRKRFDAAGSADSIVIDPHKHGLQPYGCGCVLFRDSSVGRFYKHDSAYTYFSSDELHLGEISLECSRAGAAAVALWATHRLLPPMPDGEFSRMLDDCLETASRVYSGMENHADFVAIQEPALDILLYSALAATVEEAGHLNQKIFEAGERQGLHLALIEIPGERLAKTLGVDVYPERVRVLRSVFMKAEQRDQTDAFLDALEDVRASIRP